MLCGNTVANILQGLGYKYLHHANTSSTALSFLRNNGLLSRQYVHDNTDSCYQTRQGSDEKDKVYGIFNDIFFDVENIWDKMSNNYGPVVFKYSLEVIGNKNIMITASNPVNWEGVPEASRYINTLEDLEQCYSSGSWPFANHIVIPATEKISLEHLDSVIFYIPEAEYIGDPRNDPNMALSLIEAACNKLSKHFTSMPYSYACDKYSRFYGFMSCVPAR